MYKCDEFENKRFNCLNTECINFVLINERIKQVFTWRKIHRLPHQRHVKRIPHFKLPLGGNGASRFQCNEDRGAPLVVEVA